MVRLAWCIGLFLPLSVQAATLTLEEVGYLDPSAVHYFDEVGAFGFEMLRCNCDNTEYRHGVQIVNAADSPTGFIDHLYHSPDNVVHLSHDIDVGMKRLDGQAFDFNGAYFGNSHYQKPTVTFTGYVNGSLVDTVAIIVPDTHPADNVPSLQYVHIGLSGVDEVRWTMSSVISGVVAMDSISYSVVPIPAAAWLFGSAVIGLLAFRRTNA